jgi:hypothetical protein
MPPENAPFEEFRKAVDWAVSSRELKAKYPCISHAMHAWYGSEALNYGWEELEKRLDYLGQYDFWNCNQNQYAAYWYQSRHSRLEVKKQQDNLITLELRRPPLRFLNNAVPLTLVIEKCTSDDVLSAACSAAEIIPSSRAVPGRVMFNIHHGRNQHLPRKTGVIANPGRRLELTAQDASPDFPGLKGLLTTDGYRLNLRLKNQSTTPVKNIHITWRLPLGWEPGIHRVEHIAIASGNTLQDSWRPARPSADSKYLAGSAYFVAQCDFEQDGLPGRLYLTCHFAYPVPDHFPRDRFAVLGPIPPEQFNIASYKKALAGNAGVPPAWKDVAWRIATKDGPIPDGFLDVEVIRTQGNWMLNTSPLHVLHSWVVSEREQPVRLITTSGAREILLNGERVEDNKAILAVGKNRLILFYHHESPGGSPCNAAAFLRLTDPETGAPLTDIRYETPTG